METQNYSLSDVLFNWQLGLCNIVFNLPDGKGKGTFIWEPLNTWEALFDKTGHANAYLPLYDTLHKMYLIK